MKLSSISIKGMHKVENKTYDITGFRYFHGKNGAGKSTIMQAIQLALLGYIPGTNKNTSAIFKHANGPEMTISLTIDNDGSPIIVTRSWKKKGKDITADCNVQPPIYEIKNIIGNLELPIFNFSEFIGMTANKLKDWFINFLPPVDSTLDWNTILTDAISDFGKIFDTDFVADTISHIMAKSQNGQGVQTVRDFNTFLKEQQSYFKTEVTRVQNTVQSLVYYSECDTSQSVESLKSKISSIQENIGTLNDKLLKIQQNERINAELAPIKTIFDGGYDVNKTIEENLNANSAYLDAIKTKSELDAKLAEYNIKLEFLVTRRMEIESDIRDKNHVVSSGGTCPFTCTACDTITALINAFKVEIANLENAHTEVVNSIKDITGQKSETVERIKEAEKNAEQIRQSFVTYSGLSKQIHSDVLNLNRESIVAEINTLKSQIELCNDTIIKIEANRKYEELTTALTQDKYKLEQNIEILKVWIKLTDVNGLQSQLMEAPFKKLADKMSEYLRQFFSDSNKFSSAKFFLSEKANSFSFGVVNADDEYIEFDLLSSGEKCLYTLALLLSIVEDSDSELKLIMIDDLLDHLDAARISDCFATLYNISNIQVLFAGVQNCNHSEADSFVVELASD